MEKVNFGMSNLLLFLIEAVVGVLLLVDHSRFASSVISVVGVLIIIVGIRRVYLYFKMYADEAAEKKALARGLIMLSAGVVCTFMPMLLPSSARLYAVILFVVGIYRLQSAVDMIRVKQRFWQLSLLCALLSQCLAVAIVFMRASVWGFLGISLLVASAVDVCTFACLWRS